MLRFRPRRFRNRYINPSILFNTYEYSTNLTNIELSDISTTQEETSNYSYLAPNDKKTVRFSYTEVIEEFFEDSDCVDTSIAYGCITNFESFKTFNNVLI